QFSPFDLYALPELVAACDQVIVKESFLPEELKPGVAPRQNDIEPAMRDGKAYVAGERRELFIMAHPKDASILPDEMLDDGWVYGTVSADGKHVTAIGRIASCMKCHEDAPHGRLFGIDRHADSAR